MEKNPSVKYQCTCIFLIELVKQISQSRCELSFHFKDYKQTAQEHRRRQTYETL